MKVIAREGSIVTVLTDIGETWLTRRKKVRRDSRRRRLNKYSVRYLPIKRIPVKGDWLFTCRMMPVQFGEWEPKNPVDYVGEEAASKLDKEYIRDHYLENDFISLDGSSHAKHGCSLKLISTAYAEWFIEHKVWELYEIHDCDFDKYEQAVKDLCKVYKIKYEGY